MSWLVSLYWQLHEAQRAYANKCAEVFYGNTYLNGGFLADAVGHWDHERKCVK